jgi:hypothetical protein
MFYYHFSTFKTEESSYNGNLTCYEGEILCPRQYSLHSNEWTLSLLLCLIMHVHISLCNENVLSTHTLDENM